jgi:hypothetical protein
VNVLWLFLFAFSAFAEGPPAFSKLFILGDVNTIGFQWKDLGLERETQFTAPLLRSWEKWLKEHGPKNVGEVKICAQECLLYHTQWEEKTPEELSQIHDPLYENSLWLKVSLTLRRNFKNSRQGFIWEGRVLLLDGNTKKSVANISLPREKKEWIYTPQPEINTGLVSRVYKTPLGAFPGIVQKIEGMLPLNRAIRLVITGHKHLGDVMKLVDVLQTRGSSLGLQIEMGEFGSKEAVMKVYFRGEEKSFTDLLSQVKELKSSYNYSLVNEVTGTGLVIRMVKQ